MLDIAVAVDACAVRPSSWRRDGTCRSWARTVVRTVLERCAMLLLWCQRSPLSRRSSRPVLHVCAAALRESYRRFSQPAQTCVRPPAATAAALLRGRYARSSRLSLLMAVTTRPCSALRDRAALMPAVEPRRVRCLCPRARHAGRFMLGPARAEPVLCHTRSLRTAVLRCRLAPTLLILSLSLQPAPPGASRPSCVDLRIIFILRGRTSS